MGVYEKCPSCREITKYVPSEGRHICICCGWAEPKPAPVYPNIKDSGNRTHFPTGAVRDMHTGKGRYDLMPWLAIHELALHCEAGAIKYGERNVDKGMPIHSLIDSAVRHLSCYLRGMKDEPHLRAAMWNVAWAIDMEKNHPDMQDIPARMGGGSGV